jgi:hypothetical protein
MTEIQLREPTLKISPTVAVDSSSALSARIVSCTWQNVLVWLPSPWISSGAPATAA